MSEETVNQIFRGEDGETYELPVPAPPPAAPAPPPLTLAELYGQFRNQQQRINAWLPPPNYGEWSQQQINYLNQLIEMTIKPMQQTAFPLQLLLERIVVEMEEIKRRPIPPLPFPSR